MTLLTPPDHTTPMVKTLKSAGDVPVTEAEDIKAGMVPGTQDQNTLQDWLDFLSGGVYRGRWRPGYLYKKGDIVDIAGEDNFFKAIVDTPSQRTGPGISLLHWLPLNNWRGVFSDLKSYHTGSFVEYSGGVYLAVYNINYGSGLTPDNNPGWARLSDAESLYKGPWASTNTYYKGDMVENGSGLFISRVNSLQSQTGPGADPDSWAPLTDWRGDWDTAQYYPTGTTVKHNDQVWFAIGNSTPSSPEPSGTHSKWARISPQFRGNWNTNNTYYRAEMVWHNNHMWMCRNNNVLSGSGPDSDGDNWDPLPIFRGDYASSKWYEKGDIAIYQGQVWLTTGPVVNNQRPGSHASWIRISDRYRGTWAIGTAYKAGDISLHSSEYYIARADGTPSSNSASPDNNSAGWRRISFEGTNLNVTQSDGYADIESSTGTNASLYNVDSSVSGLMSPTHYDKVEGLPDSVAASDLQNIDSSLTNTEKSLIRTRIGAGTADEFHLHNNVGRWNSVISGSDRILRSDESADGNPNTWSNLDQIKTWMDIHDPFDIHDSISTSGTPSSEDRFAYSDESVSGDPMKFCTLAGIKSALNLPDPALKANVDLGNLSSSISTANKATIRTKIGAGREFDLARDVVTSGTIATADLLVFADKSTSGDDQKYTTVQGLINTIDIPSYISPLHIYRDIDTSSTISSNDRIPFADTSLTSNDNRYTTLANLRSQLSIPNQFHIHSDTPDSATIASTDKIVFSDSSESGRGNKYTTFSDFVAQCGIPDISGKLDTDLSNLSSSLTDDEKESARDKIGAGTSDFSGVYADLTAKPAIPGVFKLDRDTTTSGSIAAADKILYSDQSDANNINKFTTFELFKQALNIPEAALGFHLYDDTTTSTSISDSDLLLFSDVSLTNNPNRALTFQQFKSSLNIPAAATGFHLGNDVLSSATPVSSDRFIFSDRSESSQSNRYVTLSNLATALGVPDTSGLAQDDLSNLDSSLSNTEKSSIRTKIGAADTDYRNLSHKPTIPGIFKISRDITTSATISGSDLIPFADKSTSGDENRYTDFDSLKLALGLPDPFHLYTESGSSATITDSDRIVFGSAGTSGNPNRYTTFSSFKTALSLPDISTKANTSLNNIDTSLTDNAKLTIRSRIGAGDGTWASLSGKPDIPSAFDLYTDVTSSATPAADDLFLLSDSSNSNSHRFVTHQNLVESFNIPAATPEFKVDDVSDTADLADDDKFVIASIADTDNANKYITASDLVEFIDLPTSYPWTSVTGVPDHLVTPQRLGRQWIAQLPNQSAPHVISHTFTDDTESTEILIPDSGVVEIHAYSSGWIGGSVRVAASVLRAANENDTTAFIPQVGEPHNSSAWGIGFCTTSTYQLMIWSNTRTASSNYFIDVFWYNNGLWAGGPPDNARPDIWTNLKAD